MVKDLTEEISIIESRLNKLRNKAWKFISSLLCLKKFLTFLLIVL
jgi:hypothetical protein